MNKQQYVLNNLFFVCAQCCTWFRDKIIFSACSWSSLWVGNNGFGVWIFLYMGLDLVLSLWLQSWQQWSISLCLQYINCIIYLLKIFSCPSFVQEFISFQVWQSLVSAIVSNTTSLEDKSKERIIISTATITIKRASSMTTRPFVLLLHIFVTLLTTNMKILSPSTRISY